MLEEGYCLHVGGTTETWNDARMYCESQGGKLVDLPTQSKVNIVKEYLTSRKCYLEKSIEHVTNLQIILFSNMKSG